MNWERVQVVLENLGKMGLEQILISDPNSIFYLTNRWIYPWERLLALYLNSNGDYRIFVNQLFTVEDDFGIPLVRFTDGDDGVQLLYETVEHSKALGIDKNMAAHFLLSLMEKGTAASYTCASAAVDDARACKDFAEIKKMEAASAVNDAAMKAFFTFAKPGITEIEFCEKMHATYIALGADGFSFSPLVGFGANAAKGHHEPDKTSLRYGDCILIDVGCKKDGYCSDMTRTFFFGHASEQSEKVYGIVRKAIEAAEAMIKPGITIADVDAAARKVIGDAGYGAYFTHRLGHFIGIEVHDKGDISAANSTKLEPGMIFSIEPGIYLPNEFGIRIEDLVLVTQTGCKILNSFPKDLMVVG